MFLKQITNKITCNNLDEIHLPIIKMLETTFEYITVPKSGRTKIQQVFKNVCMKCTMVTFHTNIVKTC